MSIIQRQNPNQPPEPVDVVSNLLVAEGDNLVYASGNVEVTRPDLLAKGDSAFMDGQREFARLMKSPSVQSKKGTPFTLTGGVIDLYSRNKNLERVVATPSGHVLSRDLELAADSVDLRVKDNQLQRVIAWGRTSRATALTPERRILADSIDALMPNQRIREVREGLVRRRRICPCRIQRHHVPDRGRPALSRPRSQSVPNRARRRRC